MKISKQDESVERPTSKQSLIEVRDERPQSSTYKADEAMKRSRYDEPYSIEESIDD